MGVQSNPGEKHQEAVGHLIKMMEDDGVTVTHAVYGKMTPPDFIGNHRPDAFGHVTDKPKEKAIGEAEHLKKVLEWESVKQLAAFKAHAMLSEPEARLYIVIIGKPESLDQTNELAKRFLNWNVKFI